MASRRPHSPLKSANKPFAPRAQPDIMEDVPLRYQAWKYLRRLRTTVPFPIAPVDAYFGCVPELVRKMHKEGFFVDDMPMPGRAGNMLQTMFATFETQSVARNPLQAASTILHVSVDAPERYIEALRGGAGFEQVFWFRAPYNVPIPRNSVSTPFFLPGDHPHIEKIQEWYAAALAMHNKIANAEQCFTALDEVRPTAAELQRHWPRVMSFVSFKQNVVQPGKGRTSGAVQRVLNDYDTEAILDLLATATLLPERPKILRAWVGFRPMDANDTEEGNG